MGGISFLSTISLRLQNSLACFMELFRRCFFQETGYDFDENKGEIVEWKMHDLVHDLAEDVAGEVSCIITTQGKGRSHNKIRHLCVDDDSKPLNVDSSLLLFDADRLRTYLYLRPETFSQQLLDEQVMKFRFLQALSLSDQKIVEVPSYIGEMKCLRYLDVSDNGFTHLPDSITKLVNLITLDVSGCYDLVKLPRDIGELVSLRHLINRNGLDECFHLRRMPPTLGELTSLEYLSEFVVTRSDVVVDGEFCTLDALGGLNLRGNLVVSFDNGVKWNRDEVLFERGHVPDSLESLEVEHYPITRMGAWWRDINPTSSTLPKLENLYIRDSRHVKHLPPLRCLPCLRRVCLFQLPSLEFIEDGEVVPSTSTTPIFPSLCTLTISHLGNLKGWSRPTNSMLSATLNTLIFPCLSRLAIFHCPLLTSLPISAPRLKSVKLTHIRAEVFEQLVSSSVEEIEISSCDDLSNFLGGGLTSLRSLTIAYCGTLRKVRVSPNTVEEFTIRELGFLRKPPSAYPWTWGRREYSAAGLSSTTCFTGQTTC